MLQGGFGDFNYSIREEEGREAGSDWMVVRSMIKHNDVDQTNPVEI